MHARPQVGNPADAAQMRLGAAKGMLTVARGVEGVVLRKSMVKYDLPPSVRPAASPFRTSLCASFHLLNATGQSRVTPSLR